MMFWGVKEVKENSTIIVNTLTNEIKELDYKELTKFNQELYNINKTDIIGLKCFHKYNDNTGAETSLIVQIVPADKLNQVDIIYPNLVNVPNLPILLLCLGNDTTFNKYYTVPKSASTKSLSEIKFKNTYKPIPLEHLLSFSDNIDYRKINGISMENIQYIGDFGPFSFFPYYPISFIKKNGSNSLIYCVDSNSKFLTKTLSEIYIDLQSYIKNKFDICADLYRTQVMQLYGKDKVLTSFSILNFSPIWMVDKTHIALKMSNTITVIDISDFLAKPQLTERELKAAHLRERMVTKGILLKRTVVENNHLKVGFLEITPEEYEKYKNTGGFYYFSLNPTIKYLDSGSIYPAVESKYDTIPLILSANLEQISPNFIAKKGTGKILYVAWDSTMTFGQAVRLCCKHIPIIYNIDGVYPCTSTSNNYKITDKNYEVSYGTLTKFGEIYSRTKYLSTMKCYVGNMAKQNKTLITNYTLDSNDKDFICDFLTYLNQHKLSITELRTKINTNFLKLDLNEIDNVIKKIKFGYLTQREANTLIKNVLHLPASINYNYLFSHLDAYISKICLSILAPDMCYKVFPIYYYMSYLTVLYKDLNTIIPFEFFDIMNQDESDLLRITKMENMQKMCDILNQLKDAYSFFLNMH